MKRKDAFLMQNVAGEWILVPTGRQVMDLNGIVTLNETGAHLWEQLAQERDVRELSESLETHFEVNAATAHADVKRFLEEMTRLGLLEG